MEQCSTAATPFSTCSALCYFKVQGQPEMVQLSVSSWCSQTRSRYRDVRCFRARQQIIIQQPQTTLTAGQSQGHQVAQTEVYQPVNTDSAVLQQGMITIPTSSLIDTQTVQAGINRNTNNTVQGTVTDALPGMVSELFFFFQSLMPMMIPMMQSQRPGGILKQDNIKFRFNSVWVPNSTPPLR
uniref:Uncharacterized protein n=1 Tax=Myripristis murdjan TaxID=586833 RepID=A0A667X5A6_9TELE